MDNFDLKRFLVENKITKNSKLHEAPHLDFDPIENPSKIKEPSNTINTEPSPSTSPSPSSSDVFPSGKTNLTVGDIITKDMLRHPNNSIFNLWGPAKILKVFRFPNSTQGRVVVKFNKDGIDPDYDPTIEPSDYSLIQGHYIRSFKISGMNNYTLKPPYRIVLPSSVSTPTSTSTPKSFSPSEPRQNTFSPLEETLNNFNLKKFLVENKVTRNSNLFEADDFEFTDDDKDLAAGLGIIELTVGDTITPDMWNEQFYKEFQNINQTIERIKYDGADDGAEEWTDAHGWIVLFKDKRTSPGGFYLDDLNGYLKPEYKIFLPDNLDEQDDDFEFTDTDKNLAARLSGSELNVGDTITPDMWDKQKIEAMNTSSFRIIYDDIIKDSYLIKYIDFDEDPYAGDAWMVDLRDKNNYNWGITGTPEELDFLNSILKDKHQIISPEPEG
jgi:hypothetical protein